MAYAPQEVRYTRHERMVDAFREWDEPCRPKILKDGRFKVIGGSGRIYTVKMLLDHKPPIYQVTSL